MGVALTLARRGLGSVWPNPSVGCVLVRDARFVARGWTQPGGRPHAETEALKRAGDAARGATAYVSLEPCAHHGATPPCADALVRAGIARCVAAVEDRDPRVAGRGLAALREAGVETTLGVCGAEAEDLNAGFFMRVRHGRPLVTLKLATSLDGRIATHAGHSQWITGEGARRRTHLLRAEHDAVMVGAATALADDPLLTCRLPGAEQRSPVRIVADGRMQLPLTARLVTSAASAPTWLITLDGGEETRREAFTQAGVEVIALPPGEDEMLSPPAVLAALGERGLTRLLVEGGGRLAAALLRAGLVDRLAWFRAPMVIGGDGIPALAAMGIEALAGAARFSLIDRERIGEDTLESYEVVA